MTSHPASNPVEGRGTDNRDAAEPLSRRSAPRRSERARTAILTAARQLARDVGYTRMSVEGIAAAAGVGKQTIYRWWPSKAAVVFDAVLEANASAGGELELPDTGDLAADLRTVLRGTVDELLEPANDRLQRAVAAEIQADLSVAGDLVNRLLRPQLEATARRIEAGVGAGQVDIGASPELVVELIFGPVFHRWLLRTGKLSHRYADELVDLVIRAVRPLS